MYQIQSQCGFVIPVVVDKIRKTIGGDNKKIDDLLEHLNSFELESNIDLNKTINENFDLLFIVHNLLIRGEPTFMFWDLEKEFAKILGHLKIKEEQGSLKHTFEGKEKLIKLCWKALHIIDSRIDKEKAKNNYQQSWENLDSKCEEDFLFEEIPKKLFNGDGDFLIQLIQSQRSMESMIDEERIKKEMTNNFRDQKTDFTFEFPYLEEGGNRGVCIEVDGPHHKITDQLFLDQKRDKATLASGWHNTIRFPVEEFGNHNHSLKLNNLQHLLEVQSVKIFKHHYDYPLYESEEGRIALQLSLSPFAIARVQMTLLKAIFSGALLLESRVWKISIIERDVPCAQLAIQNFKKLFDQLSSLEGESRTIPEIKLDVFNTSEFKECQLNREYNIGTLSDMESSNEQYDLCIDVAVLERKRLGGITLYNNANTTINIRSSYFPESSTKILCGDRIYWRPIVNENKEPYPIAEKALTYFLQNVFRKKSFRPGQLPILNLALQNKTVIGLLPTGGGKSLTYQIASFLQPGIVLIIDPTGTPISKEDKSTLGEFYGGEYIDVYTIKESVADGATVELLYDEGVATINVKKEELDAAFDLKFGHESVAKRDKLKREALRKYQMSKSRMQEVAKHIVKHYGSKIFPDGHKGMIVCQGREAALRYKEALEDLKNKGVHDFKSNVIISVGSPKEDHLAKEYHELIEWNKNNPKNQKPVYLLSQEKMNQAILDFKLPFGDESETELSGKKKFDNTAFLIVSDMLLTGYDVPIASCLYLDKPLKEHNLLQAIARVNRSGKSKNAGFIVDYNGITENLIEALKIFSGDIRPNDILKNINEEIPRLKMHHTALLGFFKPIKKDRAYDRANFIDEAIRYLEPVNLRDDFKDLLKKFNKSVNIVLPNTAAMRYEGDFRLFNELKLRARNAYPDDEDLKISKDESKMLQAMIDEHLESLEVKNLLAEPISIIDKEKFEEEIRDASPATKELKMRNNLKHTIKVGLDKNPDYYKPLAQRLEELLKMREEQRMDGVQLLLEFANLQDQIINENKEGLSKGFKTQGEIAIFNSMKTIFNQDGEKESKELFAQIKDDLEIVEWWKKGRVSKSIENKITNILKEKLDRSAARQKARELIEVLKKNKDV